MRGYFISENMKSKRTFLKKLIIIAPILVILLSLATCVDYYKVDAYNWWYIIMLPGTLTISCILLDKVDGKMKYKAVLNQPLDLKKVWISKIMVAVKNLAVSCIVIFIFTNVISLIIPVKSVIDISFFSGVCAIVVLIITFMWQIPLIMAVGNKIGMSLTVIIFLGVNCLFGLLSIKDFWFAVPFSYPARLMCPIIKILPNGLPAIPESVTFKPELLSYLSIPYAITISLILFVVLTYLTARIFEKREAV